MNFFAISGVGPPFWERPPFQNTWIRRSNVKFQRSEIEYGKKKPLLQTDYISDTDT
jgi:hypothetical protein